jgi:hypothetical protein
MKGSGKSLQAGSAFSVFFSNANTSFEISIINLHVLLVNVAGSERVWCLHPNEIRCGDQGKDQCQTCDGITRDGETSPKVVSEETVDETFACTEENGYE